MEVLIKHRKIKKPKWKLQVLLRNWEIVLYATRNPKLCSDQTINMFLGSENGTLKPWSHKGDEVESTITRISKVFTFTIVPLIYLFTNGSKLSNHPNTCILNKLEITSAANYEYNLSIHIQREERLLFGLVPKLRALTLLFNSVLDQGNAFHSHQNVKNT